MLRGDGDDGLVALRGTMWGGAVFASATTKGAFDESAKDVGKADAFPDARRDGGLGSSGDVVITPAGETKRPESVADFVAKKREIFLVQMSLDAKRARRSSSSSARLPGARRRWRRRRRRSWRMRDASTRF